MLARALYPAGDARAPRRRLEEPGDPGVHPSETATFVFSLKRPLFARLRRELGNDAQALADATWRATELLDQLGLYTTEIHQSAREQVITRQQEEMLELSTPVVKLWDGVLALPMIGTLDSSRTQVVMETLLQSSTRSRRRGREHGPDPDPAHGRVPARHDPGRHARPARDDAPG